MRKGTETSNNDSTYTAPHDGRGHDAALGPFQFEAPRDVDRDEEQGVEHGEKGLFAQVLAHLGTDHFHPTNFHGHTGGGLQVLFDPFGQSLQGRGGHVRANQVLVVVHLTELLNGRSGQFHILQARFDAVDGDGRFEFNLNQGAAGEIDAVTRPPMDHQRGDTDDDQHQREDEGEFALANEIDVDTRFDELHESNPSDGGLPFSARALTPAREIFLRFRC